MTGSALANWRAEPAPLCVISPCSSQRFRNYRNWSVANYAAVTRHLVETRGARVVLTGGPTDLEREYGAQIQQAGSAARANKQRHQPHRPDTAQAAVCDPPGRRPGDLPGLRSRPHGDGRRRARGGPLRHVEPAPHRPVLQPAARRGPLSGGRPREFGKPVEALRWGERVRDPGAMDLIRVEDVIGRIDAVLDGTLRPDGGN